MKTLFHSVYFTNVLPNIRALKLCGPVVDLSSLQYAPRAVQQDLGARTLNVQVRHAIMNSALFQNANKK